MPSRKDIGQMFRKSMLVAALLVAITQAPAQAKIVIDLTSPGATNGVQAGDNTAAIGGTFIVQQIDPESAGARVIDSFLRVQQTGTERGYNTDLGTALDDKAPSGGFTRAITLSEIPIVTLGGVEYRQFLLDINQNTQEKLSLNQSQ